MKNIVTFVLLIFLSISCEETIDMIDNCDLESDLWWTQKVGPANDFTIALTDEESFSQTHSFKISKTTSSPDSFASWGQTKRENLPINKKLTLSAKIKCANLNGRGASIVIRCDDNGSQAQFVTTENTTNINGTTDWKEYSVSIDALKPGVDVIIVYLNYLNNTSGTVYFDDIHLTYDE